MEKKENKIIYFLVILFLTTTSNIFSITIHNNQEKNFFQSIDNRISKFWNKKVIPIRILDGYITAQPSLFNIIQEKFNRLVSNINNLDISDVNKEYSAQESGGIFTKLGQNLKIKILEIWNYEPLILLTVLEGPITSEPSIFEGFKIPSFNDSGSVLHILQGVGKEALTNELSEEKSFFAKGKQYIAEILKKFLSPEPDTIALYVTREREKFQKEMEKYLQYDDLESKLETFENHLKDFNQNIEQDKQELLVRTKHIKKLKHNDSLKKGLATKIDKMASKMVFVDKDLQDRYEKLYSEFNNTVEKRLSSTQDSMKNEIDNKFKQLEKKLTKKENSEDYNLSRKEISYLIRESVKRHMYLSKERVGKQRKYDANEVVEIIQKMLLNK